MMRQICGERRGIAGRAQRLSLHLAMAAALVLGVSTAEGRADDGVLEGSFRDGEVFASGEARAHDGGGEVSFGDAGTVAPRTVRFHDEGVEMPFKEAEIFIEFNSTDEDAGIQVFLDGDDWRKISISDPDGRVIFMVKGKKALGWLGLTELFFESVEPELVDLPLAEFLALFPEGDYEFEGITNDGIELASLAEFSHVLPCGPAVSPEEGEVVLDTTVVIRWAPVTGVIDPETESCDDPADVEIEGYQVILEGAVGDLVIDLPGDAVSATIPAELLEPNETYLLEVLAKEESGNQTITESFFCTGPEGPGTPVEPCPEPE